MVNILLLGPITKDINIYNQRIESAVGGAVFYQSFVFENLNRDYTVLTTLSKDDENLLNDFPDKDKITAIFKDESLIFENEYLNDSTRIQKSNFANIPITLKDFKNLNIDILDFDGISINPLVLSDLDMNLLIYLKKFNKPIFLSIQGLLRVKSSNNCVENKKPLNLDEMLKYVDVLFLDEFEAKFLYEDLESDEMNNNLKTLDYDDMLKLGELSKSGLESDEMNNNLKLDKLTKYDLELEEIAKNLAVLGPNEVVITQNSKGSLIYDNNDDKFHDIKPYPPKGIVSPTGAGDTYMAAYISQYFDKNAFECGNFASKVASLKLEIDGPFNKMMF